MTRRRAPSPLAEALREALAAAAPDTPLARVQAAWPQAAGPVLAAQATPTAEREGTVTVSCSGAVWAQELDLLAPDLTARLNAALGPSSVRRLRFIVKAL
jgi:predicted nucleic acid-binding Zn ribbon protein